MAILSMPTLTMAVLTTGGPGGYILTMVILTTGGPGGFILTMPILTMPILTMAILTMVVLTTGGPCGVADRAVAGAAER